MRLAAGDRLGSYEILSPIGAGGMGEVYRARDPRIGRDVALKLLHGEVGRFEQEVRAAGALNHPNLLAIYDVGNHDGIPYLVSELLEGETLRARLSAGALKPRMAVDYGIGIAQGLAAAHQKGIVHRDLKPENIFLTREGRVKILDFGLAKAAPAVTADATLTLATSPGLVMGTPGYMSPEQVRGLPADHRSDIFSFGVTLYEMLSGRRAFQGDSAVETMNATLKEDAPELPPEAPPLLQRIVSRALEKEPERRFQSAADLAFALESASGSAPSAPLPALEPGRAPSRRGLIIGAGGLAASAAAFYLGTRFGRAPQPEFRRLTFRHGQVHSALFAPDGQVIVYDAAWEGKPSQIYSTRPGSPEGRALDLPPARLLAISPQGELAILLLRDSTLARVPLAGGAPREILRYVEWADWSPDGSSLMIVRQAGARRRIEFPAGQVWYETANHINAARVSRDGRHVAFFEVAPGNQDDVSLNVVDAKGAKRTLVAHWTYGLGLAWAPDGKEIWFSSTSGNTVPTIRAVDLEGRMRPILRVTVALTVNDLLPGGRALFTGITWRAAMMCQPPGETAERDLSWLDYSVASDISDDGSAILFSENREAGLIQHRGSVAYLRKTDGSPAVPLGSGRTLGISPDNQWAAIAVPADPRRLLIVPTGAGEQRVLRQERFSYYDARWFPDGKRLLVWGNEDDRLRRHYVQDAGGGPLHALTPEGSAAAAAIAPDGLMAAAYTGPGVFLFPLDGSEPEPARGDTAGTLPVTWSADGQSLYLRRGWRIELLDLKTGKSEVWKDLRPADAAGVTLVSAVVAPDGRAYCYSYERDQSDLYLAEGLR